MLFGVMIEKPKMWSKITRIQRISNRVWSVECCNNILSIMKSFLQYNCYKINKMDTQNHYKQPYHQTRSKMKTKTYGSSLSCHRCRLPILMAAIIVTIELLLFTNVSHCANAKSYVLHWNTTNSLWVIAFRKHTIYY